MYAHRSHGLGGKLKLALFAFYLLYSVLFIGLAFHRQADASVGPYSIAYLALLMVLASIYLVPLALVAAGRRQGARRLGFALAPAISLVLIIYLGSTIAYSNFQSHPFDPYLQIHPQEFGRDPTPKQPSELRIVTLGGSTTENGGLDPADRYPQILEDLLSQRFPDRRIEVLNAGRGWYTSKHSLVNFVTNMREWQPDVVVVMHGINDLYRSFADPAHSIGEYHRTWSHFYGPSIHGAEPPTLESIVFEGIAKRWFSMLRVSEEDIPVEAYVSVERSRIYLDTLADLVAAEGGTPVLMTQPSIFKEDYTEEERRSLTFGDAFFKIRRSYWDIAYPSLRSLWNGMNAHNEMVREVARQGGFVLADLADTVPKDMSHFRDDVHYTPAGTRILAEGLAQILVEEGVVLGP